jgi:Ca2+-binding RTX toxin-like protein
MTKTHAKLSLLLRRLCARAAALCIVFSAGQVAAQAADTDRTDVYLPLTGITFVGAVAGRAVAGTLSLLGCTWRDLGPATLATSYGLHGTAGNDTIHVVDSQHVFWCSQFLEPIAQSGHALDLYGGAGDDILYGGGYAPFAGNPNAVFGEAGNDVLYLGSGGARGEGGPGDDLIYGGDSASDVLIGGDGDDTLCEQANTVPLMLDGGDGDDTSCSPSAALDQFTSIETTSCTPCGPGY